MDEGEYCKRKATMTKRNFWVLLLASALLFSISRVNLAQQSSGSPEVAAQQQEQQKQQTFTGKIAQSEGKFVLQDSSGATYNLDDQEKAKQFDGKDVKVVGTLDEQTKTIHVSTIEAA